MGLYTLNLPLTVDLAKLPSSADLSNEVEEMAEKIIRLHQEVQANIEQPNASHKKAADKHRRLQTFQEGDLVMIHLRKSRFPMVTYNKLKNRKLGPFKILRAYGNNAYRLELPSDLHINLVFNVADIHP